MDRPVLVGEGEDGRLRAEDSGEVQPASAQERAAEAQPRLALSWLPAMASTGTPETGDDAREDVVEQLDRLGRRHGAVVEVAADEDGVGRSLAHELDELVEDGGLVVGEVDVVEEAPEVPVGGVDEPHGGDDTTGSGRPRAYRRRRAGPRYDLPRRSSRMVPVRRFGLSKSRITYGLQCGKRLWLQVHRPSLAVYPAETQRRFAAGHDVNDVARCPPPRRRPHRVAGRPRPGGEGDAGGLSRPGDVTLFEAAFRHKGVLVRADLLERRAGRCRMTEVKSATRLKEYHLTDVAVQTWVIEGTGLPLDVLGVAVIDTEFVYPGGRTTAASSRRSPWPTRCGRSWRVSPAGWPASGAPRRAAAGSSPRGRSATSRSTARSSAFCEEQEGRPPREASRGRQGGASRARPRPRPRRPGRLGLPRLTSVSALLPRLRDRAVRGPGLGGHAAVRAAPLPVVVPRRAVVRRSGTPSTSTRPAAPPCAARSRRFSRRSASAARCSSTPTSRSGASSSSPPASRTWPRPSRP